MGKRRAFFKKIMSVLPAVIMLFSGILIVSNIPGVYAAKTDYYQDEMEGSKDNVVLVYDEKGNLLGEDDEIAYGSSIILEYRFLYMNDDNKNFSFRDNLGNIIGVDDFKLGDGVSLPEKNENGDSIIRVTVYRQDAKWKEYNFRFDDPLNPTDEEIQDVKDEFGSLFLKSGDILCINGLKYDTTANAYESILCVEGEYGPLSGSPVSLKGESAIKMKAGKIKVFTSMDSDIQEVSRYGVSIVDEERNMVYPVDGNGTVKEINGLPIGEYTLILNKTVLQGYNVTVNGNTVRDTVTLKGTYDSNADEWNFEGEFVLKAVMPRGQINVTVAEDSDLMDIEDFGPVIKDASGRVCELTNGVAGGLIAGNYTLTLMPLKGYQVTVNGEDYTGAVIITLNVTSVNGNNVVKSQSIELEAVEIGETPDAPEGPEEPENEGMIIIEVQKGFLPTLTVLDSEGEVYDEVDDIEEWDDPYELNAPEGEYTLEVTNYGNNKIFINKEERTSIKVQVKVGGEYYITVTAEPQKPIVPPTTATTTGKPAAANPTTEKPTDANLTTEKPTDKNPTTENSADKKPTTTESPASSVPEEGKAGNSLWINEKFLLKWTGDFLTVKWDKYKNASGYDVYVESCGKRFGEVAQTVKGKNKTSTKIKKVNGETVSRGTSYKVKLQAYKMVDGKKQYIATSAALHVAGNQSMKYTNAKNIQLGKQKYTLKKGGTAKIKADIVKQNEKKKLLPKSHGAAITYTSSDNAIASVSQSGKVKAKKKGICYIYVRALNGVSAKVKVTVK